MLEQAVIFFFIYRREAQRKAEGKSHRFLCARGQFWACLNKIDEIVGEEPHGE